MDFKAKLNQAVSKNNSLLCVGLDPDHSKIGQLSQFDFNKSIIDATADLVCAYKPNSAFYEARGSEGIEMLKQTCDYLRGNNPGIPIILDAKRGDIGNTNRGYAEFAFDYLEVDAITLHPYLGGESLGELLSRDEKGLFILARTSNRGAAELQDLKVDGEPLYLKVARNFLTKWNGTGNIGLVAGATYPEEAAKLRQLAGDDCVLLVPGIGIQSTEIEKTVKASANSAGENVIISASRSVIFDDDPRQAATALKTEINMHRPQKS